MEAHRLHSHIQFFIGKYYALPLAFWHSTMKVSITKAYRKNLLLFGQLNQQENYLLLYRHVVEPQHYFKGILKKATSVSLCCF